MYRLSLLGSITYNPYLICNIFNNITFVATCVVVQGRTKLDMTSRGILSQSRKGNLSNDNMASIRTMAGVKHTTTAPEVSDSSSHPALVGETMLEAGLASSADPIMSLVYLSSPLDTILESMDDPHLRYVSIHDLIEAYSVLSSRIRSQLRVIIQASQPPPALIPLKEHASFLARALTRDVRRAFINPSDRLWRTPPSGESSSTHVSMIDHEIQYARDLTILCHHALRFLSDVFVFKPLYSLFTGMYGTVLRGTFISICLSRTRYSTSFQ